MVRGLLMTLGTDVTLRYLAYNPQITGKAVNRPIWLGVFPL